MTIVTNRDDRGEGDGEGDGGSDEGAGGVAPVGMLMTRLSRAKLCGRWPEVVRHL
jgi:hypothetical protein